MDKSTVRDAHISALVPYVHRLAQRIHVKVRGSVDVEDLIGAGYEAIVQAYDRFEPDRGMPLIRYALVSAKHAMLNTVRANDSVTERARQILRETDAFAADFAVKNGRMPTRDEITNAFPAYPRAQSEAHRRSTISLDAATACGFDEPDPERSNIQSRVVNTAFIQNLCGGLTAREQHILERHYVHNDRLSEIATDLGISSQRISQIHQVALNKMRQTQDLNAPPLP